MANNQSNQISGASNAYNPNNFSLFPDLLQPVGPELENQVLQPPAVLPEHFGGENAIHQPTRLVTVVAQGIFYDQLSNELLVLQQGTGLVQPVNPDLENQALQPPAVLPEYFGGENVRRQPPRIVTVVAQEIYYDQSNNVLTVLEQDTDLLQPVGPELENQVLQPPAVLPENFGGENAIHQPPRLVTVVAQGIYNDESSNDRMILEQGTGATPNQTILNNSQAGWMLPGPTSNIHPEGSSTDSGPTQDIYPAGRTASRPRPDLYPRNVPTRRRSAASSRAQVQISDAPSGFIPPREESPVPGEQQARSIISNCSICMNPFSDPTATKCGHVFCRICINNAYELQGRCPMCRESINTRRDLLRIYLS